MTLLAGVTMTKTFFSACLSDAILFTLELFLFFKWDMCQFITCLTVKNVLTLSGNSLQQRLEYDQQRPETDLAKAANKQPGRERIDPWLIWI
jgi:hypothetical protein